MVVYSLQNETFEMIVWRRYNQSQPGLVAALLDLPHNRHLAALPAILPMGTAVWLPEILPNISKNSEITGEAFW